MLRLSVLLGFVMFAALAVAGKDTGQMRPGLAKAVAEGREIVILERRFSETVAVPAVSPAAPAPLPEPTPAVAVAAATPAPVPLRPKVTPAPVFTLSALPSLGEDRADPDAVLPAAVEVTDTGADPEVWLVAATSVNVRQGPSTDTSVVGKLANGEAVTVVSVEGDWAHIVIEGDGIEGYVAARFLTPY